MSKAPSGPSAPAPKPSSQASSSSQWLRMQFRLRRKEFCNPRPLTIYTGTWNVNGKKPKGEKDISSWIGADKNADIYAFGFQEIVDLNASNMLMDHNASAPWEERIQKLLDYQRKNEWVKISTVHLVGLSLSVFVRKSLLKYITDVQTDTVGVGILGVGGNKGGVACRLDLWDSSIIIVNTHLAAHQNHVKERNKDFQQICQRLSFTDSDGERKRKIWDHDFLFWIGDLNYRLNFASVLHVDERISLKDWAYLLTHDQLVMEKAAGRTFQGFKEGVVTFAPTYKYQPFTGQYERRPEKKIRIPAWTDRIQWMGKDIKQEFYRRAELDSSDHKAVNALFTIQTLVEEEERKLKLYAQLQKLTPQQRVPTVALSTQLLNFESIRFNNPVTQKFVIKNTSAVVAQVRFSLESVPKKAISANIFDIRHTVADFSQPFSPKP